MSNEMFTMADYERLFGAYPEDEPKEADVALQEVTKAECWYYNSCTMDTFLYRDANTRRVCKDTNGWVCVDETRDPGPDAEWSLFQMDRLLDGKDTLPHCLTDDKEPNDDFDNISDDSKQMEIIAWFVYRLLKSK